MPTVDYTVVLADLQRQRAELDAAIAAIGRLAGLPTSTEATGAVAETIPARRASKRAKRASTLPAGDTARPTDALLEAKIRAALKQGAGKVAEIIEVTELPPGRVRRLLTQMVESRAIRVEGQSRATRYHLA